MTHEDRIKLIMKPVSFFSKDIILSMTHAGNKAPMNMTVVDCDKLLTSGNSKK